MANATENVIDRRLHGKFGTSCIFRTRNKKTFMSPYPDYSKIKWSKNQKAIRIHFREGMIWTRQTLSDPEKRKYYKKRAKRGQSVWNATMSDFLKKPQISMIDTSGYKGRKGDVIRIRALDNFMVQSILITLINALGIEVESCVIPNPNPGSIVELEYKTMESNPDWQGGRVVVRVSDSPGNVTSSFRVL